MRRRGRKNPDYSLDLQVFSSDSLEKHDRDLLRPTCSPNLNARVQLTRGIVPSLSGMLRSDSTACSAIRPGAAFLKGRWPRSTTKSRKRRFAEEYPAAAQGKYDVYGVLRAGTANPQSRWRFGMVTQKTFFDKSWAAGLRRLLATKSELRFLVDLNPFGQLFFHAMNTPCITVADVAEKADLDHECITVLSAPPTDFAGLDEDHRRKAGGGHRSSGDRAGSGRPRAARRSDSPASPALSCERWRKRPRTVGTSHRRLFGGTSGGEMLTAADILDIRQGVTPGGCLDVFLMSEERAKELGLEDGTAASGGQESRNRPLVGFLGGPRVALSLLRLRPRRHAGLHV